MAEASGPGIPPTRTTTAEARIRRRFARRQWARRWSAWRWAVALLLATAGIAGGVWLVFFSQVLGVAGVTVTGTGYLTAGRVEEAAAVPIGTPLARVDLQAVQTRVEALPAVRSAEVTRAWPDRVRVEIVERTAVAVVNVDGTITGMDRDGVLFRDYPRPPRDLPTVRAGAGVDQEARREAAAVVSAMPATLARLVDYLEVASIDRIRLVLRDGRTVTWGSAAESETKARVLQVLLAHDAQEYDVSVPGQPTTRD